VHQIELEMQNEELRSAQAEIEDGRARYFDLYDLAPVGYCTLSAKGLILEANLTAAALLETNRGELIKQPISRFIFKEDQDIYYLHRKQLFETGVPQVCELRMVKNTGVPCWVRLNANLARDEGGAPLHRLVINDIAERKEADEIREKLVKDLHFALAEIKTLEGIIPICSSCKKIRDDKGYWEQIESYIRRHSDARFSHGICPECAEKLYPDYNPYKE
jgi:PAS domain S-box-containing protein